MNAGQLTLTAPHSPHAPTIVDCVADMHLQRSHPKTWAMFAHYLQITPAQHILILGDLFEVWVGDDALNETGSFEAEVAAALQQTTAAGKAVYFMHGNRDFVIGEAFANRTGVQLLQDPTVLQIGTGTEAPRWLLSHGDALCTDDLSYQQFRTLSRNPAWQQQFLTQPLTARRAFAASIRSESENRKQGQSLDSYVDLNTEATKQWLQTTGCNTLIHGHTHMPAEHDLGNGQARIVMADWDMDSDTPRAEVLRYSSNNTTTHWQRIPISYG
ncbi:UDP-2,3-diacylglucosamine diphosphatase [Lampropedia puyangensis]|uniref:UDP-2,3-diacylglucosamine hydrolase n=1 Tax=Lampropedia puyangensis TaxID=1330072 RepID=A0A4S8EP66_9BURK|nr:UDP-2,3-diacylglucosamine diphosphatase [Lampropedia puyangensis]THT96432.1 UDP-2,3-diacylglucosamine diphosphatase [Lampropedia puyangensis]